MKQLHTHVVANPRFYIVPKCLSFVKNVATSENCIFNYFFTFDYSY